MRRILMAAAGVAAFVLATFVAGRLNPFWISFPVFCAGVLALGVAGDRVARDALLRGR